MTIQLGRDLPAIDFGIPLDLDGVCTSSYCPLGEPGPELFVDYAEELGRLVERVQFGDVLQIAEEYQLDQAIIVIDEDSPILDDLFGFDPCVYGICLPEYLQDALVTEFAEQHEMIVATVEIEAVEALAEQLIEADTLVLFDTATAAEPEGLPDFLVMDSFL